MGKRYLLLIISALLCVVMANATIYSFYVAEWDESTNTLTFKGTMTDPVGSNNVWDISDTGNSYPGWRNTCYKKVRSVVFDESFSEAKPKSCCSWFDGFTLLTSITGISYLNTSQVVTMKKMFIDCDELTEIDLSHFDTRNVTDMSSMFDNCMLLKSLDLSSFSTSNVTDMNNMFRHCEQIKKLDLKNFDTANVTNMNSMFKQSGLTSLDVSSFITSKVTDMCYMFGDIQWINKIDLSNFATSNVIDMSYMFYGCTWLKTVVLTSFDTSKVQSMKSMFHGCNKLESLDLNSFNVSNVFDFDNMFMQCSNLNTLDLNSFHLVNAKKMQSMFDGCTSLTSISFGSVATMENASMNSMFKACTNLKKLDLSTFDTKNVTSMSGMFSACTNLISVNLSSFDTRKVSTMSAMFNKCSSLTEIDLSNFDISNVTDISSMFYQCSELKTIYVDNTWSTDKVTASSSMFLSCPKIVGGQGTEYKNSCTDKSYAHIDGGTENPGYLTEKVTSSVTPSTKQAYAVLGNGTLTFYYDELNNSNTSQTIYDITNGSSTGWFERASDVTSVVFDSSFKDYTGLTTLAGWFSQCVNLASIEGLEYLNTTEVTSMNQMFLNCQNLTSLDVSHFETSKVTDMRAMFSYCMKLKSVVDLSNFDTSNVTDMGSMFKETRPSEIIFGSKLNTTNLSSYESMFQSYSPRQITFTGDVPSGLNKNIFSGIGSEKSTCYLNVPQDFKDSYKEKFDGKTFFGGYFHLDIPKVMYAEYEDNGTLTFYYKEEKTGTNIYPIVAEDGTSSSIGWIDPHKASIKKVVFDASFADARPVATDCWFSECSELKEIEGLGYLNTSDVVNMESMFAVCRKLTILDISNFNTSKVTNMNTMFADCSSLTTIYVGDNWSTSSVTTSDGMFANSTNLVGGRGTAYNSSKTDYTYAHIDEGSSNPGYFTRSGESPYVPVGTKPYAVLSEDNKTLTFYYDTNKETNNGMDVGPFTVDANGVSSGWFNDRESIETVVFNSSFADYHGLTSTSYWFYGLQNLKTITGIENLNTENVTDMQSMFYHCESLTALDLSHFDTSNVFYMQSMFTGCAGLTSLDVSKFNNSKVMYMDWMFMGCNSLTSLDLSNFDTQNVAIMRDMFRSCSSLTTIYVGEKWSIGNNVEGTDMFQGCTSLVGGQGTVYNADHTDHTYAHIDCGTANPGYFTVEGQAPFDPEDDIIHFKDAVVKSICVTNWDTSGDGELSYKEAKAVTGLNRKFANQKEITSFDELQYFTGLKALNYQEGGQFEMCEKLESITLPEGLEKIGEGTFNYCRALKSLRIPASVTEMSYLGGWYYGMTEITVAADNTKYDSRGGCNAVIETASNSNTLISGCNATVIPNDVEAIGPFAFNACVTDSIAIPSSVTTIGKSAFSTCLFTGVGLPASITSIGEAAFNGCASIKHVTSEIAEPFAIKDNTFTEDVYSTAILWVPTENAIKKYKAADGWKKFQNIRARNYTVEEGSQSDGQEYFRGVVRYNDDNTAEITNVEAATGNVQIPSSVTVNDQQVPVTSIVENAFANNSSVTSVTIPESITSIGDGAFANCKNLEYVDLSGSNVTGLTAEDVASGALSGLNEKTVVVLPEAMSATDAKAVSEAAPNIVYKDGSDYKAEQVQLTDGEAYNAPAAITSIEAASVSYPRTFDRTDVVYSICLPYDQPIGEGLKAYELEEYNSEGQLVFKQASSIEATKPYLIKSSGSVSGLNASNVTMQIANGTTDSNVTGYDFCGTLKPIPNSEASGCLILQSDQKWHPVGEKGIASNRAYLKAKANAARITGTIFIDDTTGIKTIDADGTETYYDLQGRRISKPQKGGIYVKNGKKVAVK